MTVLDSPRLAIAPSMLAAARERVGLTLEQAAEILAEKANAPDLRAESDLRAWEEGREGVPLEMAEALALVYLIPFSWFFADVIPPLHTRDYRTLRNERPVALSYETLEALAFFDDLYEVARRVVAALELSTDEGPPKLSPVDAKDTDAVEVAASLIRASLDLTDDNQLLFQSQQELHAFIISHIERSNVFVFSLALPLDECRGASRWDATGPASILVNTNDSPTAQLFTLVHEYVHLAFNPRDAAVNVCDPSPPTARQQAIEWAVNRVTAAVLVPRTLLDLALPSRLPDGPFTEWPTVVRGRVQRAFHVSREVIGIRLFHLGLAPAPGWTFWRQPSEPWGRSVSRAVKLRRAFGSRTSSLLRRAFAVEAMNPTEVSRLLGAKYSDIESAVGA